MARVANSKLLETDKGIRQVTDAFVVIVKTEWNAAILDELEKGCRSVLKKQKVKNVVTLLVPGAVEIPFAIKNFWDKASKKHKPDAFIALGCVIKGDTPHFEYVCQSVTQGITTLNTSLPIPSVFGILTVNTEEQAQERIGGKHGHKGEEAAITALKMIALARSVNQ